MKLPRPRHHLLWGGMVALSTLSLYGDRCAAQAPAPTGTAPLVVAELKPAGAPERAAADPLGPQTPQVPPKKGPDLTPKTTPKEETPASTPPQTPDVDPGQSTGDTGGESAGIAAANMMGDLLLGTRNIRFFYSRGPAGISPLNVGSTTVLNSAIDDNNSPVPQNRVYFRFNHFSDAQSVVGLGDTTVPPGILPNARRTFDVEGYTFGVEKTFLCDRASVELRVPFTTGLGLHQNFIPGVVTGAAGGRDVNGNPLLNTATIPGGTLGTDATDFGNLTLIFKGMFLKNDCWAVSGGLGLDLPTASSTRYRIVDFSAPTTVGSVVSSERLRTIDIGNNTVNLAPFLAALWTPTETFFVQGFSQIDVPAGRDPIHYHVEKTGRFGAGGAATGLPQAIAAGLSQLPPFDQSAGIADQTLLHLDLGVGYWFNRDQDAWIRRIAPTLELHYTTTLCNAQVVQLRGDGSSLINNPAIPNVITRLNSPQVPEPGPRVGNDANRVDLLDLTLGVTVMVGDRVTIANGFAFPLNSGGDNRTFNWEYQLQLNYYFGGPRGGSLRAPNF